jgi:hypothetical protein
MHFYAFQDLQQFEQISSVSVKRASRGSAAPGSLLVAATLDRIFNHQLSCNVRRSFLRQSNDSGLNFDQGTRRKAEILRSWFAGLIYRYNSGSNQIQMLILSHSMSALISKVVSCTGPTILPPIALANPSFNRTNTGMLRTPAFAG